MSLSRRTFVALCAAAAVLCTAAAFSLVATDPRWFYDREALHNATVAQELLAGQWRHIFTMQYMPFCGGCSVESVMAAASFSILGVTFVAWKLVPILFGVGVVVAGADLLRRSEADDASLLWLVLMLLPPILLAQSMVMGWANHFEVMALVLICAGLAETIARVGGGPLRWGVLAALFMFTAWFSLTGAVAAPALCVRLWPRLKAELKHRRRAVLGAIALGALLGASPWLAYVLLEQKNPFEFAARFQTTGGRLDGFLDRLNQLSLLAYGGVWQVPQLGLRTLASWTSVVTLWAMVIIGLREARRVPMPALLAAAYGGVYALSPFQPYGLNDGGLPPPIDQRYLIPWFIAVLLCSALGLQLLWRMGWKGRVGAVLALTLMVLPGAHARWQWWTATPSRTRVGLNDYLPYDYGMLNGNGLSRVRAEALESRRPAPTLSYQESQRALGQRLTTRFVNLELDQLPAFAEELRSSDLEVRLLVQGLGRELRLGETGMSDAPAVWIDRVHTFGALLTPLEGAAFFEAIWVANQQLGLVLPDDLHGCGLCPAKGASYLDLPDSLPLGDLSILMPDRVVMTEGAERRELILGAGSYYGFVLGHAPELLPELGYRLKGADKELLRAGFERGAAIRWRR